jgi:hypothetical protein
MANYSDDQLATMSIFDVVRLSGGNNLVSPPFQTPLNFLGIFGWQHVDAGVEALVCEGQIVADTRYNADIARLFGRRRYVRRVLLKPAPLTDVKSKALTSDKLELTLTVSLKYEVRDPVSIASLQDPLAELSNRVAGAIAEYIRGQSFESIISDDGQMRAQLQQRLVASPSIRDAFNIIEVLKALPSGDERLIEASRKARAAEAEQPLIEQTGINKLTEAKYLGQIALAEAEMQDAMAQRQHERDMEQQQLHERSQLMQQAIKTFGDIASAGINPSKMIGDVMGLVTGQAQPAQQPSHSQLAAGQSEAADSTANSSQSNQASAERDALASLKDSLGFVSCEVFEAKGRIKGALIQMPGYEIVFTCAEDYPTSAPKTTVRFPSGETMQPTVPWVPRISNLIAQAALAVVPQVKET